MIRLPSSFPLFACGAMIASLFLLTGCGKKEAEPVVENVPASETTVSGKPGEPLSPEQQQLVLDGIMKARARQQAEGLGGGKVTVNGAWNYNGYSFLSPNPSAAIEARLVAVDITVSGHTEFFDIDDIEIVDGASLMSYGSDPHATPLNLDGSLLSATDVVLPAPNENRWLLIYAYPKKSPKYRLYYWGQELTSEALDFKERGLELPFPPAGEAGE